MKRISILIASIFILNISFAAFPVAKAVEKPVVETKEQRERVMMEIFVKMSVKDYENLVGKKMNFVNRLAFKMKKKHFEKQLNEVDGKGHGFSLTGFALGFLLLPLGVLFAYLFSKDTNLRKWAWIGFAAGLVFVLLISLPFMIMGKWN